MPTNSREKSKNRLRVLILALFLLALLGVLFFPQAGANIGPYPCEEKILMDDRDPRCYSSALVVVREGPRSLATPTAQVVTRIGGRQKFHAK